MLQPVLVELQVKSQWTNLAGPYCKTERDKRLLNVRCFLLTVEQQVEQLNQFWHPEESGFTDQEQQNDFTADTFFFMKNQLDVLSS